MKVTKRFKTVNEYIKFYPKDIGVKLEVIRDIIKETAPKAEEGISYNMPAFNQNGVLVYFSAHTNHIGLYPYPSAIKAFKKESLGFKTGPGTIQFPLDKKLPVGLIKKIVKFRVKESLSKKK